MGTLPTGTVTFLFTDIEGSTKLWQQHPAAMPSALALHHSILNDSITAQGGYVFQIIGDAFCAAFPTAKEGLGAAIAAQRALRDAPWGDTGAIRVRMALHTGAAEARSGEFTSGEYVSSLTLSRTARLLSAGHGGQILLSLPTAELVRDDLPPGGTLRDLDAHRLKDLARPEHIYQVAISDLPSEFAPLKTLDTHLHNLPTQLTSFVGREREMARARALFDGTRLLTLTGAGGTGKTRLALQLAAEMVGDFPDGVWFVELAALTDPTLIIQTVVSVLGLQYQSGQSLLTVLSDYLHGKATLLLLDNCEHLIDASARFAQTVLQIAPGLKILAASREALGIPGERTYHVPSLALPPSEPSSPDPQSLAQYEAVRLFVDRALAVQPEFVLAPANASAVAQICHRLDGIPLAIELAAARVRVLSAEQISARLDDAFRVLTGGSRTAMPRHQTLRASIDWSHGLLEPTERVLFRRLAVFAGGWTLDEAEGICPGDGIEPVEVLDLLQALVGKSLVAVDERTHHRLPRYYMLETIRQYAREKLSESGEGTVLRDRHLDSFLQLAAESNLKLHGPEQLDWLNRLDADRDNFRAALTWAMDTAAEKGLYLVDNLSEFWRLRGYSRSEAREWFAKMLALPAASAPTAVRARVLGRAASSAYFQGNPTQMQAMLEESVAIWSNLGDKQGLGKALDDLGRLACSRGNFAAAEEFCGQALSLLREQGDKPGTGRALLGLGAVAAGQRDWKKATDLFQESLAIYRDTRDSEISFDVKNRNPAHELAFAVESQGDFVATGKFLEEALALERELGNPHHISWALRYLGDFLCRQGDFAGAKSCYESSLTLVRNMKDKFCTAHSLTGLALVAEQTGDCQRAAELAEEALALYEQLGYRRRMPRAPHVLGRAISRRDCERGMSLLKSNLMLSQEMGPGRETVETLEALGSVYISQRMAEQAVRFFAMADAARGLFSFPMTDWERGARQKEVDAARGELGEKAFVGAWEEGCKVTMEQAIAYALEQTKGWAIAS